MPITVHIKQVKLNLELGSVPIDEQLKNARVKFYKPKAEEFEMMRKAINNLMFKGILVGKQTVEGLRM